MAAVVTRSENRSGIFHWLNLQLSTPERFQTALFVSAAVHAIILLGVHVRPPEAKDLSRLNMLDVVLVNSKSVTRPDNPQALAQASLDGGGNTDVDRMAKSPLPALEARGQEMALPKSAKTRRLRSQPQAVSAPPPPTPSYPIVPQAALEAVQLPPAATEEPLKAEEEKVEDTAAEEAAVTSRVAALEEKARQLLTQLTAEKKVPSAPEPAEAPELKTPAPPPIKAPKAPEVKQPEQTVIVPEQEPAPEKPEPKVITLAERRETSTDILKPATSLRSPVEKKPDPVPPKPEHRPRVVELPEPPPPPLPIERPKETQPAPRLPPVEQARKPEPAPPVIVQPERSQVPTPEKPRVVVIAKSESKPLPTVELKPQLRQEPVKAERQPEPEPVKEKEPEPEVTPEEPEPEPQLEARAEPAPEPTAQKPVPSAAELMKRSAEIARLEAQIAKQWDNYQKRPRRKFVGARTSEHRLARYVEEWRVKVERIGNLNYPEAARQRKLYGSLQLTVAIKANGSVESVEINRSSGQRILDAAAIRIVELCSPFGPFPPDISKDTDILHITRTWTFTRSDQLISE